jgi:hypothetical protein
MQTVTFPKWLSQPSPQYWLSDNYLVLDFETQWEGANDILLVCWELGPGHPDFKEKQSGSTWGGRYEQQELLQLIRKADFIVAHYSKFELKWLGECGYPLEELLAWCTQIAEYVHLGNRKAELSLDAVAIRYGFEGKDNVVKLMIKNGVCPSRIPTGLLEKYCRQDVSLTHRLFLKQRNLLRDAGQLGTMLTRCIITPVLVEIEQNGLFAAEDVTEELVSVETKLRGLELSLKHVTGGINHNSPKQIAAFLYDTLKFEELKDRKGKPIRTDKDGRKTGQDVIVALKAHTPEQKEFQTLIYDIIGVQDEFDFLNKMHGAQENANGLIRAVINQTVTQTHRFSSNGVPPYNIQFQNIARERKFNFGPRFGKDWEIFEADQAQLEFRAAVQYGRDKQGISDIWDGFDVHNFSAKENNLYLPDGSLDRQTGKIYTFRPIYYGGRGGRWFEAFRGRYKGIAKVQDTWLYRVLGSKELQIETGLKFYWPNCRQSADGYISPATQICNYPIQSLCGADIVPIALTYMWHYAKRMAPSSDWLVINTVHDQGLFEIKKYLRELFTELAVKCNTTCVYEYMKAVYNMDFVTPLGVGLKAGPRWSEGDEIEIDVNIDGTQRVRKNKKLEGFYGK